MKGSGAFILSVVLISVVLISYLESLREAQRAVSSICGKEAQYAKLSILRNAIQRSYEKTDHLHLAAWRIAVQTALAEEYGVTILIDNNNVTIISSEPTATSTFCIR